MKMIGKEKFDIKRNKIKLIFLICLTIVITIVSLITAINLDTKYYLLLATTLPLIYLSVRQYQRFNKAELIANLREKWGLKDSRLRDFSELDKHFKKTQAGERNKYALDDRTWNDLDMNSIFVQIDRTMTIPGELTLYSLLRQPLLDVEELDERNRVINLFSQNQEIREKYQLALSKLGKKEDVYDLDILWEDPPPMNNYAFLYIILLILIPIFILLGVFNYGFAWFGLGATLLCNMFIHYRTKGKIYEHLSSLRYLGKLIRCAKKLTANKHPVLDVYLKEIENTLSKVSYISKKTSSLGRGEDDYISEYYNVLSLTEVRAFYSVLSALNKYQKELGQLHTVIGFTDAMISIASYRAGLKSFIEPQFINSRPYLKIKDLVHPLLKEPVSNSLFVESENILITGSNMSGKTTFLKAIGVNAVLAQTIYTSLAKEYQASFFHVLTLIGRMDNVIEGKSYYLDEINALLRIINALESRIPCLCLLDEIFRGTNSIERISSSAEVLLYFARHNCLVFASTHDLELTELVSNSYSNFHFLEKITQEGISFNYKLMKGPSTTRNATKLLRHIGYPSEIVDASELRVRKAMKDN
jgi:DNA mismatch repair ATPase MutS